MAAQQPQVFASLTIVCLDGRRFEVKATQDTKVIELKRLILKHITADPARMRCVYNGVPMKVLFL